jgi:4-hydroxy-3-methylbut-2-enyl diphosphate reductase
MRVRVSTNSGFCWGVKRAFDTVLNALRRGGTVHTLGPLVHNENAIRMLEKRGLRTCTEISEIESGTVVVRAHGMRPDLEQELVTRGLHVVDATCPHVRRIQQRVEKAAGEGRHVCIVGYRDHPEVIALVARAGEACSVIAGVEDAATVPRNLPVFLTAQSTFNESLFERIRDAVTERRDDVTVFDSICRATGNRQQEVRSLAGQVEAVVVVGSHTSSNTKRLAEIARDEGAPTYHVTSADELDPGELSRFGTVAVVSGASTPNWVTRRVVEALLDVSPGRYGIAHSVRRLFLGTVESGLYASAGAAALTVAACRLQGVPIRWEYLAAAL